MKGRTIRVIALGISILGALGAGAQDDHHAAGPPPGLNLGTAGLEVSWASWSVKTASPEQGLRGRLRGLGTAILFESQRSEDGLRAVIRGPLGEVFYEYQEVPEHHREILLADGTHLEIPEPPKLVVLGVPIDLAAGEGNASLRTLAARPEGLLIRQLGLELVAKASGEDLVEERRGLELATQALWPYFETTERSRPRLTSDYEINAVGYLVHTQPEGLVLGNNRVVPQLALRHDDSRVNSCLGRCGEGCTGGFGGDFIYHSDWYDVTSPTYPAHQQVRCVSGEDWIDTWYAVSPVTHSVTGWWTPGCQLHDNCQRSIWPDWLAAVTCLPLVPVVPILDSLGEHRTWSYTDYNWQITSYNAGYSGCTCPGHSPYEEQYECVQ
ncbi:MAG: hypothetical protein SF066_19630 [Thermoanaerobaculia bacterium]|nr:hypothetical protein [Thermoanaerobaculia bacterium]